MAVDPHAHAQSERFIADLIRRPWRGLSDEREPGGRYAIRRPVTIWKQPGFLLPALSYGVPYRALARLPPVMPAAPPSTS
jgi:hypothetical protein